MFNQQQSQSMFNQNQALPDFFPQQVQMSVNLRPISQPPTNYLSPNHHQFNQATLNQTFHYQYGTQVLSFRIFNSRESDQIAKINSSREKNSEKE